MGWQDDPIVDDSAGSTSVSTDQLQAQAGKYTPDQMAAFDTGRGQLLADELREGNTGVNAEVPYLNPVQKAAFNQQPTSTPMAKAPWENDPIAKGTVMNAVDKATNAIKSIAGPSKASGYLEAAADTALTMPFSAALGAGGYLASRAISPFTGTTNAQDAEIFGKFQQALTIGNYITDPKEKAAYEQGMGPLNWALETLRKGGEMVTDQMLKSKYPWVQDHAALAGALSEAIAMVAGGKVLHSGGEAMVKAGAKIGKIMESGKDAKADATANGPASADDVLSNMELNSSPTKAGEPAPMFTVKGKPIKEGAEQPLGVDATPDQMTDEFNSRQSGFNFDPLEEGENKDLFDASNRRVAPDATLESDANATFAARQGNLEPMNPNEPPKPSAVAKDYISQFEKTGGLKEIPKTEPPPPIPQTGDIFSDENLFSVKAGQENSAWEKYQARVRANQEAQAALDSKYSPETNPDFQPAQQSNITSNKKLGGVGRRGFGQGGAVNFGNGEDLGKRLEDLKNSLAFTDRSREAIKTGDTVRLMNGKVGVVTDIKEGRYFVSSGDFKDSVPIQGIDYKYKPQGNAAEAYRKAGEIASKRPLGGTGKAGFGQGGAINFRNIFNAKDPNLHPEEPKGVDVPLTNRAVEDILYKQWNRAQDLEDFRDGLNIEKKLNPGFPQALIDRAAEVYGKYEDGYRPKSSAYGEMSNLNRREASDNRPFEQAIQDIKLGKKTVKDGETGETIERDVTLADSKLRAKDDINGFTKEIQSPLHLISTNWHTAAGKVYNWAYSNLADINRQWSTKLAGMMKYHEPFLKLSRTEQKNVTNAEATVWDTNANRQILIDRGLMWPTKEMLMDKQYSGLSSAEADAYLSHAKGYDEGYKAAGIDQPKLPGYMPHTWDGMWRANIFHPTEGLVEVYKGTSRRQVQLAIEQAKKQGLSGNVVEPKLSNKHDFVATTQQMIQAASNMGKLGKAFTKVLVDIQDGVMQGTITESLERKGIKGYLGDDGIRPESLMNPIQYIKNRTYNNKVMGVYEKAMNDFARAGRNRQIIEAVAKPFFRNLDKFQQAHNLVDAVKDLVSTATGFRASENVGMDRLIKQFFINRGLNPGLPGQWITSLNTFARIERINSLNLGFAAEHAAFALPGMFDLLRMHYERGVAGEAQGSYTKALGAMGRDAITFGMYRSAEGMRADKWAHDNGIYSSNYYDNPQFKGVGGRAWDLASHKSLEVVINRAKSVSFQMAYRYFRDIMPEEQALRAAANHTKKTMQSFDPLDTPEIFKEGYGGKSIRPFNQIHFYNMARAQEMIMSYVRNVKDHPLAAQKLLIPAVGLATTYLLLGGAKGIPFHDDWNLIRGMVNEADPNANWPSFDHMMLEAAHKVGLPDWVVWGAVPHVTGADIRGTFTFNLNPENLLHGAGLGAGWDALALGFQEARKVMTGEANADEIYKHIRRLLPTTAVPWLEDSEAEKLGGNIPKPSKLDPTSPRTPEEDKFFKIFSKRAISESMRNEKVDMQKEQDAMDARWRQSRTRLIVNKALGFDTGWKDFGQLIDDTVKANRGYNIKQLSEDIKSQIPERQLPEAITFIKKAAAANKARQASMFTTLLDTLQGDRLGR